ncbi:MAG: DUF3800 domain-containing protein [Holophagaceae bacterium]
MYVDESGDAGSNTNSSRYYILSGMVLHDSAWRTVLDRLVQFRRRMKGIYRLRQRDEIHASAFIHAPLHQMNGLNRGHRLGILRAYLKELGQYQDVRFIHVIVDKQGKPPGTDVFEIAWKALLQRFENTMQGRNFPGSSLALDYGMVLPDDGNIDRLRHLLRKIRVFNPIPNRYPSASGASRNLPIRLIVEDPVHRDSRHSYFIQCVDTSAYFLQQYLNPNKFIRQKGARNYFLHLQPALCRVASPSDPLGLVRL